MLWTTLDAQTRRHLGCANKQLHNQMLRNFPVLKRHVLSRQQQPRSFAPHMVQLSMQSTLHSLILTEPALSAQDVEALTKCQWPEVQLLELQLCCTPTMEEVSALADGSWPSLLELKIISKSFPHEWSRREEAAIRLFLRGRWPNRVLWLVSNLWPVRDGSCTKDPVTLMQRDAWPGDEYRTLLYQSACR